MSEQGMLVSDFVDDVGKAMDAAAWKLRTNGLRIAQVDLEFATSLEHTAGCEFKVWKIGFKVGGTREALQTVSLTLVPRAKEPKKGILGTEDQLVDAIEATVVAAHNATMGLPTYALKSATATVTLTVGAGGTVSAIVEAGATATAVGAATLSLEPV